MRLVRVEIEGYRSIAEKVDFHIDRDVTVLLGANDHGKTNILSALLHLNPDHPFNAATDLNWDRADAQGTFPHIVFHFALDPSERESILELAVREILQTHSTQAQSPTPVTKSAAPATPAQNPDSIGVEGAGGEETLPPQPSMEQIATTLRIERQGLEGKLLHYASGVSDTVVETFLRTALPRVELIRPQEKVPDAVNATELKTDSHEFMRGIFYYAGLPLDEDASLFTQTDVTMRRLQKASVQLNDTLKTNWSQGKALRYELAHESKTDQILLRIEDPSVASRLVRASQRSSGFTHFFNLKTVLYARQKDHPANSYIFLFDEPGIFLHPSGQYDLLQVLDAIGKHNQVLYTTHSLFMINKTFPARHRLIVKMDGGTKIDGKPFVGRWGPAIEELGLSLAGTILFAQYVLLAEGDADPMLIQALFQKLVELGKANIDLNAFSVISTGSSTNTDALIRILKEGATAPRLFVLVDGDKGGTQRLKKLSPLLNSHSVDHAQLESGTTIEDYMPSAGELYVTAAARYVSKVVLSGGDTADTAAQVEEKFREAAANEAWPAGGLTSGMASWAIKNGKQIGKLTSNPSKVGIAREYIDMLMSPTVASISEQQLTRALTLVSIVQTNLGIPELREPEMKVTADI